ncbi:uncharacterized protein LOC119111437 [Pollicipes pollicipes]|uniref:uncharacterized protein LOC119111437 n=1 Tax=Pollicipes pollicipes TaxID=41117 RepID=UPI001884E74F|nr:uncharacterized protein LOC119111437 [Pollicipes pollicipes]
MSVRNTAVAIDDALVFHHPLMARLVSARRFLQLSWAWRLKDDDQTPDQFVDFACTLFSDRYQRLLMRTPRVMSLQTFQLYYHCDQHFKTGRYVVRVVFHKRPEDTVRSGNWNTMSTELLEKLLNGVPLTGGYFTAAGGATVDIAKFFHQRGAFFVGSVGAQTYRLLHPEGDGIPAPEPPSTALYVEPWPGIREVVLLREYSRNPNCRSFIGFPITHLQQTHLICNIGAGATVARSTMEPVEKPQQQRMPQNLRHLHSLALADLIHVRNNNVTGRMLLRGGCMLWHQRVLLHLLFTGFMNGWQAHAVATGLQLFRMEAADDIVHHLTGFMLQYALECDKPSVRRTQPRAAADSDTDEEEEQAPGTNAEARSTARPGGARILSLAVGSDPPVLATAQWTPTASTFWAGVRMMPPSQYDMPTCTHRRHLIGRRHTV